MSNPIVHNEYVEERVRRGANTKIYRIAMYRNRALGVWRRSTNARRHGYEVELDLDGPTAQRIIERAMGQAKLAMSLAGRPRRPMLRLLKGGRAA
jgi:hypothetical protein